MGTSKRKTIQPAVEPHQGNTVDRKFYRLLHPKAIKTLAAAGLLTCSICDAFPAPCAPVAKEYHKHRFLFLEAGTYSSGNCPGFSPGSLLIPCDILPVALETVTGDKDKSFFPI